MPEDRSGDLPEYAPFNALALFLVCDKLKNVESDRHPNTRPMKPREHSATATI